MARKWTNSKGSGFQTAEEKSLKKLREELIAPKKSFKKPYTKKGK